MKNLIFFVVFLLPVKGIGQSTGTSCANALQLFPAGTGDCNNTSGPSLAGQYMCESGDCAGYSMPAGSTTGVDGSCTGDNDGTQIGTWLEFVATANNITITNMTDYSGPGAGNIEMKDYVVFSGSCGSLTQIGCSANVSNGSSFTVTGLTAGTTYKIWVTRSATSIAEGCSTCNLAATCLTSTVAYNPSNESCATATSLTTNVTLATSNAEMSANGPICSGSVENDSWYQWCAPAGWPVGQLAYISVYDQVCNTTSGLQMTVWNTGTTCPTSSASAQLECQNPGATTSYYYDWVATAGTCYYITIDGFGGTACSYNLTVGSVVVLPSELVAFDAKQNNLAVDVEWTVASQTNNDFFTVERSVDGVLFEAISIVDGSGTLLESKQYKITDIKPKEGVSYYRLRQTDYDNNVHYSSAKSVNFSSIDFGVNLYPNPSVAGCFNLDLDLLESDEVFVELYDIAGKQIFISSFELPKGHHSRLFNLPLKQGHYTVSISTSNKTLVKKLVVESR